MVPQDEQDPKCGRWDREKIDAGDVAEMIIEKCPLGLRARFESAFQASRASMSRIIEI